jgi:hypothetical protein
METFDQFSTLKNYFENRNFEMFREGVHNFGKSDGALFIEKMLISTIDAYVVSCPTRSKNLEKTLKFPAHPAYHPPALRKTNLPESVILSECGWT